MKIKTKFFAMVPLLVAAALVHTSCQPLKEFRKVPVYTGTGTKNGNPIPYDQSKKTIAILAYNEGTEIFDLMAPYYLFNATEKANVYIVAEKKSPIVLLKGMYIYPTATFAELDSLQIKPDVIVIPAMIKVFQDHKSPVIQFIKEHYAGDTKVLSVCAGSLVGAATGLYDGKPLTTHASEFEGSQAFFKNPQWIQNRSVTQSGNLYGTAGVSNAVEGSLTLIRELFDEATLRKVMNDIHYPHPEIKMNHKSIAVKTGNKFTIAGKLFFRKNRKVGVLLQDGIDELMLAAVVDTYNRTFPYSLETLSNNGTAVTSKYGLTILPTSASNEIQLDELHILSPDHSLKSAIEKYGDVDVIRYSAYRKEYIIDQCLLRIKGQYGERFENITKLLLDYN